MDGLILDVPMQEHVTPFVPPVCLSPVTAQVLAVALVVVLSAVLIPTKGARR